MSREIPSGGDRRRRFLRGGCVVVSIFSLWMHANRASAGPTASVSPLEPQTLRLQNAVAIALRSNFGIGVRRLEVASAQEDVAIARATFEPAFTATGIKNTNADIAGFQIGDYSAYSAAVGTRVPTGATVTLSTNTQRTVDEFNFPGEQFYDSDVHLSVRQPLLKGGGLRYNLSPLVLGKIGVAETDYELQKSILDLIRNVEVAYWEVVFSYRERGVREETVAVAQRLLDETLARGNVGLATGVEPLQA